MTRAYYWFWKGLLKDVGGSRANIYGFLFLVASFAPLCVMASLNETRKPPAVYITQEDYYRSLAESKQRKIERMEAEKQRVIDARSKKKLSKEDVEALISFACPDWSEEEVKAMLEICWRESRYYALAQNPKSTAYGLYQFLDSTWRSLPKTSDPLIQTFAAARYIEARYSTSMDARAFHDRRNYY